MRIARSLIGACMLSVGWAGGVAAGPHVDWLDDGSVLLKLGPDYGDAVIETSRAELGSLLGPDQQPFAGKTIRLLSQDDGPHGAISGPLTAFAPVFEELTGAKVELDLVPVTNLYSTLMLDLQRGQNRYDAASIAAYFYGELIDGKFIRPIDDLAASGKFPRWSYDAMPDAVRRLYTWDGAGYGVPNDADGQVLYYRRDVLADPAWREPFKQALGYDLPVPPRTWQQVLDIATLLRRQGLGCRGCAARPRHGPAPQAGRAGPLPLPVAGRGLRDHARRDARQHPQCLLVRPGDHEAADRQPRQRGGAGDAAGARQDRAGGAARLATARGLELFPARQGRVHLLVRRSRRALPGSGGVAGPGQVRRGDPARHRTGTGTMRPSNGSRRRIRRRSAIPPAAPGRASSPAARSSPRRPTRSCR